MKRRSIAGGKPAKTPRRTIVSQKQRSSPKRLRGRNPSGSGQETEVARLRRELNEAVEQQKATTDVLRVISSSPGQLEPIFRAMLEEAVRILEAKFGTLFLCEGNLVRPVAGVGLPPKLREFQAQRGAFVPPPGLPLARLIETKKVIHMLDDPEQLSPATKLGGARSHIAVPMLKERKIVGAIYIYRQEVKPFTDKQIELVKNFAAQAVIAIENARLLNELRQSLEQQKATSEVLQVISRSHGDLQPVFEAMLANAVRICDATFGNIYRWDRNAFSLVATHNTPPAYAEARRRSPVRPNPNNIFGLMVATKAVAHVPDAAEQRKRGNPEYALAVELGGVRTCLAAPMLKEHELIGSISLFRQEVRPFTDEQIALITNFAAQAVIAIENARLLNELRQRTTDLSEALEQQTATSDVLKVIANTQGELEPVFDAILANATRICEAELGTLVICENDGFRHVAGRGLPPDYVELRKREPVLRPLNNAPLRRLAANKQVIHVVDLLNEPARGQLAMLAGSRTQVLVPLLKDDSLIGAMVVFRKEVRPFTDKTDRSTQEFRSPSSHRHRERAIAQRTASADQRPHRTHRRPHGSARAADCNVRGAPGYLKLSR